MSAQATAQQVLSPKTMKTAYIVAAKRSAVGKSKKGGLRFKRPDELASDVIKGMLGSIKEFDYGRIDDMVVGNAMPEAEQGLNMARQISLLALDRVDVPGTTINRWCASGLDAVAAAVARIQTGMAECIVAGGVESMSYVPMGGYKPVPDYKLAKNGHEDYYWGMGLTAEEVAKEYNISREAQDEFALRSHHRALAAQEKDRFQDQIVPIEVEETYIDDKGKKKTRTYTVNKDEGPRKGSNMEALAKLRPVFAEGGSVTAGNSSQTSDGAAFTLVMSEEMVKDLGLEPIARLVGFSVAAVEPRIMGIAPIKAIPKVLKQVNLNQNDMKLIELNEAFASQSVAIQRELNLNEEILNVNGGAIALGHPLGCTGAKLTVQILDEMRKRGHKNEHCMVTMCVGTGQGAAGVYEFLA